MLNSFVTIVAYLEIRESIGLVLTGVELFIILGTAVVQMYFIKNLFDNRLVV